MSGEADVFAKRAWTVCGTVGGGVVGLVMAPRMQRSLRFVGVDQVGFAPALVISVLAAALSGFLTWRAMRD